MTKKTVIANAIVTKTVSVLVFSDTVTGAVALYTQGSKELKQLIAKRSVSGEVNTLSLDQVKEFTQTRRVVLHGQSTQGYLIKALADGLRQEGVYSLYDSIVNKHQKGWTLTPKAKSLFGPFDIENVFRQGVSYEDLASRLGLNIEHNPVFPDRSTPYNLAELEDLLEYAIKRARGLREIFLSEHVQGEYLQMSSTVERYLGGKDRFYSQNGSRLATSALTRAHDDTHRPFKNHKKAAYDWVFNGRSILERTPDVWKEEILAYGPKMEAAYKEYISAITSGKSERLAGEVFKGVPFPTASFPLTDKVTITAGGGGLHTKHKEKLVRRYQVHHHDIEGAYTAMILGLDVFSPEIAQVYQGFKNDKFAFKALKRDLEDQLDNGFFSFGRFSIVAKDLGITVPDTVNPSNVEEFVNQGVLASKLATNKPTGVADENGSALYNPIGMTEARICLQVILYDFAKRIIEAGGEVLSINTDGLFWCDNQVVDKDAVVKEWADFWGLAIGYDFIDQYIAKSDNDRILVKNGRVVEATGDDLVHQQAGSLVKLGTKPVVVDQVILQKLLHPDKTLEELLDERIASGTVADFAFTTKADRNSKTVLDRKVQQRVNRFLLTTEGGKIQSYNVKTERLGVLTNVPDSPVTIFNKKLPDSIPGNLNRAAYLKLIQDVYGHWI